MSPLPISQVVDGSTIRLGGFDFERLVEGAIRRSDLKLRVEDEKWLSHRRHDALGIFPGRLDEFLGSSPVGDVPKNEDHPDDIPSVVFDGRRTVVDGSLAAVSRDEESILGEPDGHPSLDDLPDRLLDRLPCRLMNDAKDLLDLLSGRVGERPSGQLLGDGIEIVHATLWVSGDHAVADAGEGNLEPLVPVNNRVPYRFSSGAAKHLRWAHENGCRPRPGTMLVQGEWEERACSPS